MRAVLSVNLTKEAFDRLCEVRDYIFDDTGEWYTLNQICSTLICQVSLPEDF